VGGTGHATQGQGQGGQGGCHGKWVDLPVWQPRRVADCLGRGFGPALLSVASCRFAVPGPERLGPAIRRGRLPHHQALPRWREAGQRGGGLRGGSRPRGTQDLEGGGGASPALEPGPESECRSNPCVCEALETFGMNYAVVNIEQMLNQVRSARGLAGPHRGQGPLRGFVPGSQLL